MTDYVAIAVAGFFPTSLDNCVILSAAKNLLFARRGRPEILRCAQNDKQGHSPGQVTVTSKVTVTSLSRLATYLSPAKRAILGPAGRQPVAPSVRRVCKE